MSGSNTNRNAISLAPLLAALLLSACGSRQPPPAVEDTAFSGHAAAMEKARAVEGTMQQHRQAMDEQLQRQENAAAE
jgi:hypothetical protein